MKYVPCSDSAFYRKTEYCAYDATCYRMVKDNAKFRRTTDSRDGTVCGSIVVACPC